MHYLGVVFSRNAFKLNSRDRKSTELDMQFNCMRRPGKQKKSSVYQRETT